MEESSHWEPIAGLRGNFLIEDLRFDLDGLMIKLISQDQKTTIEIVFNGCVEAYRYTNESWCFDIFGELHRRYGIDFFKNWSLFTITNSNYVKSLSATSARLSESTEFNHFCIAGDDEIIDILATYHPTVTIIS